MFKKILVFAIYLVLIFISGCERHNQAQFYGLGTYITAQVQSKPHIAKSFIQELKHQSQKQEKQLYAWGNGELAELNKYTSKALCFAQPSVDLVNLLIESRNLNQLSDSLFEPAIAPLVELWNFHDVKHIQNFVPDEIQIKEVLKSLSSISNLKVNSDEICTRTKLQIDLGAIAKGWGARQAELLLQKHSLENALIDFGGDIILKGKNANDKPWTIGLRDPSSETPPASFSLYKKTGILSVFTSGDYEREFTLNNKRYHHILDPRTGYPANELRSVTVIHESPMLADAAATALFVAGTQWQSVANKMGIEDALVIFPNKKVEITRSLSKKTTWLNEQYKITVVDL